MKVIARRSSPQSRTRWRRIAITAPASPATQAYRGPATRVSACSQRICVSTSISSSASPAATPEAAANRAWAACSNRCP
ncbi:hypothetical protein EBI_27401 [Enterocytozoon bieneusi H348]|nr:hypothetical protein EBI_27401 [Enterocytozoon bieneusi H348]|eukprot:XP_002652509.1 hypothetical protein EBI_27401 [Enterocytozoon bieneusi H348]